MISKELDHSEKVVKNRGRFKNIADLQNKDKRVLLQAGNW